MALGRKGVRGMIDMRTEEETTSTRMRKKLIIIEGGLRQRAEHRVMDIVTGIIDRLRGNLPQSITTQMKDTSRPIEK